MNHEMQGVTMALTSGGAAEGTNAATFQFATDILFAIDGRLFTKTAADNLAFSSGHTTVPVSSSCLFGVYLDTAGAVTTVQGPIVLTADLTAGAAVLAFPGAQAGKVMVAAIRVATNASVPFVPGTTDLGAAGITDTYYNLSSAPTRPLTS